MQTPQIKNCIEIQNNILYIRDLESFRKIYKTEKNTTKNLKYIVNNSDAVVIKSKNIDLNNSVAKELNLTIIKDNYQTLILSNKLVDDLNIEEIIKVSDNITNQFLYVIKIDGTLHKNLYKIGLTTKLINKRLEQLRINSPFLKYTVIRLYEVFNCIILEKEIHKLINEYRIAGEYFNLEFEKIEENINKVFEQYKNNIIVSKSVSDFNVKVVNQTDLEIVKQYVLNFIKNNTHQDQNNEIIIDDLIYLLEYYNEDPNLIISSYKVTSVLKILNFKLIQRSKYNKKIYVQNVKLNDSALKILNNFKKVQQIQFENEIENFKIQNMNKLDFLNKIIETDKDSVINLNEFHDALNYYFEIFDLNLEFALRIAEFEIFKEDNICYCKGFKIKKEFLIELRNKQIKNNEEIFLWGINSL